MASNGSNLMKEKLKAGTGEKLLTLKVIKKPYTKEGNTGSYCHTTGQHRH